MLLSARDDALDGLSERRIRQWLTDAVSARKAHVEYVLEEYVLERWRRCPTIEYVELGVDQLEKLRSMRRQPASVLSL